MSVTYTSQIVDDPAWDAGASFIDPLLGSGAYLFTVGKSAGIVCGLSLADVDVFYSSISHAFWIEAGKCKIMEHGVSKTGFFTTTPTTVYKIERIESTVYYYIDNVLRYVSLTPLIGTAYLDCSLYTYGDVITTAELIEYDGIAHVLLSALQATGNASAAQGDGHLVFSSLRGFGEIIDGELLFQPLQGHGFELDGMGGGKLSRFIGSGDVAEGNGAALLSQFVGFGTEFGVFYGQCDLPALTCVGFEIYERPDFNQGWGFLQAARGYGSDYPDFNADGSLLVQLIGRGTATDLVGGLTFQAFRMDAAVQYDAYFNIPIKLNLRNISYNITYDSAEFSESLSGEITAYSLIDSITNTVSLSGRLSTTLAHSDTGYAIDSLNSTFSATATDNAQFTDILGPCDWAVVAQAFIGEGDRLLASDVIASSLAISGSTTDIALAIDSESAGFLVEVSDSIVVQEVVIGELALWAKTTDIGIITESFNHDWAVSGLSEQISAIDAINTEHEITHADTATVSDELILQLRLISTVDESVIATVDLGYSTQETGPCDETATFAEVLILSVHQHTTDLSDALTATDLVLLNTSEYATLLNSGIATDALTATVGLFSPLTESFVATTGLSGTLNVSSTSADTGVITDLLLNEEQTLYVINADTGAVSTYIVSPVITGLAQYEGILYMAGPQGLEALDASSDAGVEITWTVHTGFNNFGTDFIKRLLDVNLQARIQKDTNLVVVSNQYGQKYSYRYRLPILTRDSYRDGVIKVGKGISSVYWQVILQGKGEAEIDQIRLRLEALSRRR